LAVIVGAHVCPVQSPIQSTNFIDACGVAVSVGVEPLVNDATHVPEVVDESATVVQLIPPVDDVTVPPDVIVASAATVSVKVITVNVAVMFRFAVMTAVHDVEPVQSPVQLVNVPDVAAAANGIDAVSTNVAVQPALAEPAVMLQLKA
jgi:hypothetical protein